MEGEKRVRAVHRPMARWVCRFLAMRFPSAGVAASLTIALACAAGARGAEAQSAKFPHGTLTFISDKAWIQPAGEFVIGAHFTLEPGWHIYWVNPGDSGEPPRFTWKLPAGISAGAAEWPAPRRLGSATVADFGYDRDVTLLIPMKAGANAGASGSANLSAEVRLLICREVCIPGRTSAALNVPIKAGAAPVNKNSAALINAARQQVPEKLPAGWRANASPTKDGYLLSVQGGGKAKGAKFFPLVPSQIENAAPQQFAEKANGFVLTLKRSEELEKPISRLKGVIEFPDGKAYVVDAPVVPAG